MIFKNIDEITHSDVQNLYESGALEKGFDFKRILDLNGDAKKKTFLADVCAFANTGGGDIIVGVDEKKGLFPMVLSLKDKDQLDQQISQIISDGIQPRVRFKTRFIPTDGADRYILIIRVFRSYAAPHMITFQGSNKFYTRIGSNNQLMNVHDIRSAFIDSEKVEARIGDFVDKRVQHVTNGNTPVRLKAGSKFILHIVPVDQFMQGNYLDPASDLNRINLLPRHDGKGTAKTRLNFAGLLAYQPWPPVQNAARNYCQLFRTGALEYVSTSPFAQDSHINGPHLASIFMETIYSVYADVMESHRLTYPLSLHLTICDVVGYGVSSLPEQYDILPENKRIDQQTLTFIPIFLEEKALSEATSIRPWLNTLWQAAGYERCNLYDNRGSLPGIGSDRIL